MARPEWFRVLAAQHGVISRAQALTCGLSSDAVSGRLSRREWLPVHPGVYRSAQVPVTSAAHLMAAALWAGPEAVIGGAAAAWWWGLTEDEPTTIELDLPRTRQLRSSPPVTVVRRGVCAEDRTVHLGLPVVTRPFAALFGAVAMGATGRRVFDRALLRRHSTLHESHDLLERNRGMRGAAVARQWVTSAQDGSGAESERLFIGLLRGARINGWTVNRFTPVGTRHYRPDFCWAAARLIVEIDGWAFHSDPSSRSADHQRQNALIAAGWRVIRFTWDHLTTEPEYVIAVVRGALQESGEFDRP